MWGLKKKRLLLFSGVLFLLAASAFWFSPVRWMTWVEGCLGIAMLIGAARVKADR